MLHNPDVETCICLVKMYHVECTINKDYLYNGCYGYVTPTCSRKFREMAILSNPQYFVEWDCATTKLLVKCFGYKKVAMMALESNQFKLYSVVFRYLYDPKVSKHYTTLYGPSFQGPWVIYDNTRGNLDRALTRQSCVRGDGLVTAPADAFEREALLRANNATTCPTNPRCNPLLKRALKEIRVRLNLELAKLQDVFSEQIKYSRKQHVKLKIRLRSMADIINKAAGGTYFTEYINGKLKLFERAKPGKYPRLIGDFTTPGSLLAGFLAELAKSAFGTFSAHHGFHSVYCHGSDQATLDAIGEAYQLSDDRHDYFSDDSIFKLNGKFFEMDITSCDMSQTYEGPFCAVLYLFNSFPQFRSVIAKAIGQCGLRVRVQDPTNKRFRFSLKPAFPIEFSGSGLTTLLNNVASMAIGLRVHYDRSDTVEGILNSAFAVGYNVTVSERRCMEQLQFLKYSWFIDYENRAHSWLNLGPILRSFGTVLDKLPGKDKHRRANACARNTAMVSGYVHCGQTIVYRTLRRIFPGKSKFKLSVDESKHFRDGTDYLVPDEALLRRYSVSQACLDHFISLLSLRDWYGLVINHEFVHRVYVVDYGCGFPAHVEPVDQHHIL
jgi:hypothetical protein